MEDVDVTRSKLKRKFYERELGDLQLELVKLQHDHHGGRSTALGGDARHGQADLQAIVPGATSLPADREPGWAEGGVRAGALPHRRLDGQNGAIYGFNTVMF
jgi:hypothetical protein